MIGLELLGLQDAHTLALNDAEGNRYLLPITDELRAALRRDVPTNAEPPKPMTPREIQAHFRAGLTMEEVSEMASIPPSQLAGLASPILAEREYTSQVARAYRQGQELGGLTLEELVISRLVSRNVAESDIEWDAYRDQGEPWTLVARYTSGGKDYTALWTINSKSQSVVAKNDEAAWLTETQIEAAPWRALNTPEAEQEPERELNTAINAQPASQGNPVDIDSMLASLNSKRGTVQPMPEIEPEFDGAHPPLSDPDSAQDATVLQFPGPKSNDDEDTGGKPGTEDDAKSAQGADGADKAAGSKNAASKQADDANEADSQETLPGAPKESPAAPAPKRKRRNRPSMPSWDEIVFGYSKDD